LWGYADFDQCRRFMSIRPKLENGELQLAELDNWNCDWGPI
jgi:hypothetical protein